MDAQYELFLLSAERNPPIEEVISQGVIPRFVQFLQRSDLPPLQVRWLQQPYVDVPNVIVSQSSHQLG